MCPGGPSRRWRAARCPTFTQDVHDVPRLQVQVFRPLGRVAVLGHHLAKDRPAARTLWQRGRCRASWAPGESRGLAHGQPPLPPRPTLSKAHPALQPQPRWAGRRRPPGSLQRLLLGEGHPAPGAGVLVTELPTLGLQRERLAQQGPQGGRGRSSWGPQGQGEGALHRDGHQGLGAPRGHSLGPDRTALGGLCAQAGRGEGRA